MLNRGTPDSHGIGILLKAPLRLVEHILMLPAGHSSLRTRCALVLEVAAFAVRAPVPMQLHTLFHACKTPYQGFASRAAVLVLVRVVDEVSLIKSTVSLRAGCLRRWNQSRDAGLVTGKYFFAFEVTAIRNYGQRLRTD